MKVKCTKKVFSIFKNRNIHTTIGDSMRFKIDNIINVPDTGYVEEFSAFLFGVNLYQMGSFSYSWSNLPINTQVGRYCSIASNVKLMGMKHPLDRISTSSFSYDNNFAIFENSKKKYRNNNFEIKPVLRDRGILPQENETTFTRSLISNTIK